MKKSIGILLILCGLHTANSHTSLIKTLIRYSIFNKHVITPAMVPVIGNLFIANPQPVNIRLISFMSSLDPKFVTRRYYGFKYQQDYEETSRRLSWLEECAGKNMRTYFPKFNGNFAAGTGSEWHCNYTEKKPVVFIPREKVFSVFDSTNNPKEILTQQVAEKIMLQIADTERAQNAPPAAKRFLGIQ